MIGVYVYALMICQFVDTVAFHHGHYISDVSYRDIYIQSLCFLLTQISHQLFS